jgi:hypothetical protein
MRTQDNGELIEGYAEACKNEYVIELQFFKLICFESGFPIEEIDNALEVLYRYPDKKCREFTEMAKGFLNTIPVVKMIRERAASDARRPMSEQRIPCCEPSGEAPLIASFVPRDTLGAVVAELSKENPDPREIASLLSRRTRTRQ